MSGVFFVESKINFKVVVSVIINLINDLNVMDEVMLDGLINVELVYF